MVSPSAEPFAMLSASDTDRRAAAQWINARIGLPWVDGAEGPHAYGCWGLARAAQWDLAGRALKTAPTDELVNVLRRREAREGWRPSLVPSHLCLVYTNSSHEGRHVGVWLDIDRGVVAHSLRGSGVITSSRLEMRVMGFQQLRFVVYAPDRAGAMAAEAAA